MLPKYLNHSTFSSYFWSIIIVIGDGCLEILITFVFSTFISMPYQLPISISLSIMPCSTVSSLAISTRSSASFTVWTSHYPYLLNGLLKICTNFSDYQYLSASFKSYKYFLIALTTHIIRTPKFQSSMTWRNTQFTLSRTTYNTPFKL